MSKALVIAEKPSVAADLARALGKFQKEKDFFENDQFVITSAIGHLVEIHAPADQEVKRGKWSLENLPIIPTHFDLSPIEKTESRFNLLKKLIKRKDVTSIINACDAGREGELIFRYILQLTGANKPIKRLWLQSMTPTAIRENFGKLRTDEDMLPLADAAMCRSEADWLVGINGTRALTAFNSKGGGFQKTTVGRVQTPTLSVLVEREARIRQFQPKAFWEVYATFDTGAGSYEGRYFEENFHKTDDDSKAERIWDKAKALDIVHICTGQSGIATEESKTATQASPLLFDLTSLQREANGRFGFPARMTLSIAQALYEKHKVLTYPRTDSRYLPDDYQGTAKAVLQELSGSSFAPFAKKVLSSGWVKPNKRIFNQAKVSDHFAIIPTTEKPSKLSETEQKIYDMVVKRFLAVFYPPAVYEVTTRVTKIKEHAFKTEGKVLKEAGWREVYGVADTASDEDDTPVLVPIKNGQKVDTIEIEARELVTKPPPRFSEATLLSAMEGAGKLVEDEELRDAMSEKGLGTPATRAAIIEGLISENYVLRQGRELIATAKAFNLLDTLNAMNIQALSSPELTGGWEYKLKLIEQRKFSRKEFMEEINSMTRQVVERVRGFDPAHDVARETDLVDPFSGEHLIETLRDYRTKDDSLQIRKAIAGRIMEESEIRQLLQERVIGPLDGFRSRLGRPFRAKLKLTDAKQVELDWGAENSAETTPPNFSDILGTCPKDGGRVITHGSGYVCEHTLEKKCDFRIGHKILEQEITREQAVKLLTEKKTDLLTGFVSQRTKRPFKAFLVMDEKGKVGFEFPPREAKPKASKKSTRKGKKASAEE